MPYIDSNTIRSLQQPAGLIFGVLHTNITYLFCIDNHQLALLLCKHNNDEITGVRPADETFAYCFYRIPNSD